jgi:hypothetical protein
MHMSEHNVLNMTSKIGQLANCILQLQQCQECTTLQCSLAD